MKKKLPIMIKADPAFEQVIRNIKLNRIKIGKDTSMKPTARITLAMTRHNLFQNIVRDIERADLT